VGVKRGDMPRTALGGRGVCGVLTPKTLVAPGRLERPTRGLGNRCSVRLSYGASWHASAYAEAVADNARVLPQWSEPTGDAARPPWTAYRTRFFTVPSASASGGECQYQSGPRRSRSGSARRPHAHPSTAQPSPSVGAYGKSRATIAHARSSVGWNGTPSAAAM